MKDLEHEKRFHQLLVEALDREPGDRLRFLAAACGEDRELLDELRRAASRSDESLDGFLERPPGLAEETRGERLSRRPESSLAPRSMLRKLRATPGVTCFWVLAALAPILVGAAVYGAHALTRSADVEMSFSNYSGRIRYVSERWSAVSWDDEIVAIGGVLVDGDPARIRAALLDLEPGVVTFRTRRDGTERETTVRATRRTVTSKTLAWTRVATGALLLVIGCGAFLLRPGAPVTWVFLSFCAALGLHLLAYLALLRHPAQGITLETLGYYLSAATGLHLFLIFPQRLVRQRLWAIVFYLPAIAAAAVLLPLHRDLAAYPLLAGVTQLGAVYAAVAGVAATVLVLVQYRRARRARQAVARARSRVLLVAVALGLALPAVLGVLRWVDFELDWAFNSFLVVIFVTLTAYAVARHNALDLDRLTAAILGYGSTILLLVAALGVVVVGVPVLAGASPLFASPLATAVITAAFLLLIQPLYRRVKARIDRWFQRERGLVVASGDPPRGLEPDWSTAAEGHVGPYRVLGRLGTGGMAEVLLAEKHGPGGFELRVAMKRMLPHLSRDPGCVAMFLDEARIAARLHHPHVVQIHDIEEHEGTYFLTMEYVDGPTLTELIREARQRDVRLPLPVVAAIATAVLGALEHAHDTTDRHGRSLRLVHRDVKPGNILLNRQGEIKLTDFGVARAEFRLHQTQPGLAKGTLPYMAPEQHDGGDVGPEADLFAAGAVIYEALARRRAFPAGTLHGTPVPLSTLDPRLPAALDDFLGRALAPRPADRFASAAEMRAAFLAAVAPVKPATAEEVAACVARLCQDDLGEDLHGRRRGHAASEELASGRFEGVRRPAAPGL